MIKIKFSDEAEEMMNFLRKEAVHSKKERMIFDSVVQKIKLIEMNSEYGQSIKKKLIPKFYRKKYLAKNLFRVELPQFWRMLYTLRFESREVEIIAFILDVVDHKEYNRKFKYRQK